MHATIPASPKKFSARPLHAALGMMLTLAGAALLSACGPSGGQGGPGAKGGPGGPGGMPPPEVNVVI